jgi:hypothetical protein
MDAHPGRSAAGAIRPQDLLDLGDYERARPAMRAAAMQARALRRVQIGPDASLVFENRETVTYQIQEMLRSERLARPEEVAHEVETYNELMPGPSELSATLFLEFADPEARPARLADLVGIERSLRLEIGGESTAARFDARQIDPERVSAVQFVRFPLSGSMRQGLFDGSTARLRIDHPRYRHEAVLQPDTVEALAHDLEAAAG